MNKKERNEIVIVAIASLTIIAIADIILTLVFKITVEEFRFLFFYVSIFLLIMMILDIRELKKGRTIDLWATKNELTNVIRENITDCLDEITKSLLAIEDAREQIKGRSASNYEIAKEQSNVEKQIKIISNIIAKMEIKELK